MGIENPYLYLLLFFLKGHVGGKEQKHKELGSSGAQNEGSHWESSIQAVKICTECHKNSKNVAFRAVTGARELHLPASAFASKSVTFGSKKYL